MQTIAVETQVADHLRINLSWGEVAQAPETSEFIRLDEGEEFTIPAGHATSIRSIDGWQKSYAFKDTSITGPVDISKPQPMLPQEFAPTTFQIGYLVVATFIIIIFSGALFLERLSGYGPFIQICALFGIIGVMLVAIGILMKATHRHATASGEHSCDPSTDRTFWRADLTAAQTQDIRL